MNEVTLISAVAGLLIVFGGFITYWQKQLDTYREEARAEKQELKTELRKDVLELQAALKEEREQRQKLETRLREVEAELNQFKGKNAALTETNTTLSTKLEEAQRARGTVEAENRLLQAGNTELKNGNESLRDELANERAANKLLREQLDAKQRELEAYLTPAVKVEATPTV